MADKRNDNDVEKGSVNEAGHLPSYRSQASRSIKYYEEDTPIVYQSLGCRIRDSFKRDPNLFVTPAGVIGVDGRVFNPENAVLATANSPLARKLKGRHLQMIAIGGSIGSCPLPYLALLNLMYSRDRPLCCVRKG